MGWVGVLVLSTRVVAVHLCCRQGSSFHFSSQFLHLVVLLQPFQGTIPLGVSLMTSLVGVWWVEGILGVPFPNVLSMVWVFFLFLLLDPGEMLVVL